MITRGLPAGLLLGVAAVQLVAVHGWGVSRWRGGGMGMYSEFHPNRTVIREVRRDGESREIALWPCTRVPTERCLARALGEADPSVVRLEAWRPRFAPGTRTWWMEEVARASR